MMKFPGLIAFALFSCQLNAQTVELSDVSIVSSADGRPLYRASSDRSIDIIHTQLAVEFDWSKRQVKGEATITLSPHFYAIDTVVLDAKGMFFHHVALQNMGESEDLIYRYDGKQIHITAPQTLTVKDTIKIYLRYTARPDEVGEKGSAAISDARGLYFINPNDVPGGWMRQVWTQGEPTSNSCWFPTVDHPNERMTHELAITVPESYKTLSNGRLDFQTENGDGTRTDFWLMDMPHAPYLVMLAAGEFYVEEDEWNGIPVNYFVEPEYAELVRDIYPNTTEMLTFFSDILNVEYPWQKYDQITVREYVSGAMENTTAVVFGDQIYGDEISLASRKSEDIVSHEMFHHWFGDLVTCESWANLPLNESFATYGEVLWREHKYGRDNADWHRYKDMRDYLTEFGFGKSEDLIRYDYQSVGDMFDRHTYSKGGCILHMLRTTVGDEAFFKSLETYLRDNAYTAVEIHHLRLAFEKVTGRDLNWFFNQWFLARGHPQLQIEHSYDREAGEAVMTVRQTQDLSQMPLYRLPVEVAVHTRKGVETYPIEVTQVSQEFRFPVSSQPLLVQFDSQQYLLAEIDDRMGDAYLLHQIANGERLMDRYDAISQLLDEGTNQNLLGTITRIAMDDKAPEIRRLAFRKLALLNEAGLEKVRSTVEDHLDDESPLVRAEVYDAYHNYYGFNDVDFYRKKLDEENHYDAMAGAFGVVEELDPAYALQFARENFAKVRGTMRYYLAATLLQDPNSTSPETVIALMDTLSPELQVPLHYYLAGYLSKVEDEKKRKGIRAKSRDIAEIIPSAGKYFNIGYGNTSHILSLYINDEGTSKDDRARLEKQFERLESLKE